MNNIQANAKSAIVHHETHEQKNPVKFAKNAQQIAQLISKYQLRVQIGNQLIDDVQKKAFSKEASEAEISVIDQENLALGEQMIATAQQSVIYRISSLLRSGTDLEDIKKIMRPHLESKPELKELLDKELKLELL